MQLHFRSNLPEERDNAAMALSNFAKINELCNEVLTSIELSEMKLLNWGFIDILIDLQTQLPTMLAKLFSPGRELWSAAQQSGITHDDILRNLIDRRLVLPLGLGYQVGVAGQIAQLAMSS